MSGSVSGLSEAHRVHARDRAVEAALLAFRHRDAIHYTQGARRWQGIARHDDALKGAFPNYADCSSFTTWCLYNGLHLPYGLRDVVNGADWRYGYTGTQLQHGKRVLHEDNIRRGDLVIYGHGFPGSHVAICIGGGRVISHGSERGPLMVPLHYRNDVLSIRRFI